jgi:hypothetical protein
MKNSSVEQLLLNEACLPMQYICSKLAALPLRGQTQVLEYLVAGPRRKDTEQEQERPHCDAQPR